MALASVAVAMKRWTAAAVVLMLVALGARVDAGRKAGRKLGVKRLSEFRSGPVVVSQQVDLARGFRRLPVKGRLGRDHHGIAMKLDDSTPGTLRFTNSRARGLPITEVRTWDGASRRWKVVFVANRRKPDAAAVTIAPRIAATQVAAVGSIQRTASGEVASVQLRTYRGRGSGIVRLAIDVFNQAGKPMNYHLELPALAVSEALAGLPVEEGGWQLGLTERSLEMRSARGERLSIDRAAIERLWDGS